MKFENRTDAGEQLGEFLARCVHGPSLVLAIPLGGVPVAAEVARILHAPLDVVLARDIQAPPPHGIVVGGVSLGGSPVLDRALLRRIEAPHHPIDYAVEVARGALSELLPRLRGDRPLPELAGRTVIVVDEGIETGYRALAAARMLQAHGAAHMLVAAPVCSPAAEERLGLDVSELVYLECPDDFSTTASHYEEFAPVTEAQAVALLAASGGTRPELYGGAEINGVASPPEG